MRRGLKVLGIVAVALLAIAIGYFSWLYFYVADLPPISQLAMFNPVSESQAQVRSCDGSEGIVTVVPRQNLGRYTVAALTAAEGRPDSRSPYIELFSARGTNVGRYQLQLARTMACPSKKLSRRVEEVRIANAINRTFKTADLLTIYLNRVDLGRGIFGVEAAARKYFGKSASSLTLEESALLAALISRPTYYSPQTHPDRAIERRNRVLDEMVVQGSVSAADATLAKSKPIQIVE